ncbi:hypothetical protein COY27_05030 [Candidatus Woesearchaeota archaeon CG_4_10_14_0_2_um_filter_33_13]|nr:MAG: hypothetical protein COY27_05030 [Candidatus Woesearchaeota archaeon CG_4_10_14_0_2_um_filter_33_13]
MDKGLKEEISNTIVIVHSGRYAYLKSNKSPRVNDYFLVSKDKDEITIVTEEKNISKIEHIKDYKWFKLIEFKITKPFLCVGFLATVSKIIADKGLNILLVSTFSKDYALINEIDIEEALNAWKEKGFKINYQ